MKILKLLVSFATIFGAVVSVVSLWKISKIENNIENNGWLISDNEISGSGTGIMVSPSAPQI